MNIEFELKFYVEVDSFKQLVKQQGGHCIKPITLMKRWVYLDSSKSNCWIRVRDEADRITLSYKSFNSARTIDSVQELELTVDDFDKTCQMVELLGFQKTRYVENMREVWQLDDCLLMIDQWPGLEQFVEVEGPSKKEVEKVVDKLGLDLQSGTYGPTARLYEQEYGISKEEYDQIKELTFDHIPVILKK